ncbi:alpha/beta-hydrolase [Epithele typhae]|uniref:alpha/beta-hydrolase n=1 Tax=Epithele typhae TaxID=378194 RepID=UPI0020087F80|nr:alpha/beta-hydrolase [Epithele typhae]KAH9942498.1 alpha/beta-hydrolase [Epithele typhae]
MPRLFQSFLSLAALAALARAAPAPLFGINFSSGDESDDATAPFSQDDIVSTLTRPAEFARAVYCSTGIADLSCGGPCDALGANVKILANGGDGASTPFFLVASDSDAQTIFVAHQGTEAKQVLSVANDVKFVQKDANATLFPQASADVQLHDGFQEAQGRTADAVLAAVTQALADTGFKSVMVTGHSLGAAIATLDAAMLKMAVPDDVAVDSVVFGLPRVGNQAWADLFDSLFPTFAHVTNQNDPVPNVPPHALAFQHPSGELHITAVDAASGDATVVECPGQENENCSAGNSLLDTSIPNHLGPYFSGISFGGKQCPKN